MFSLTYRSHETGSSSVWGTDGMGHGSLQFGVRVKWNRDLFIVGYRSNCTGRSSV